MNIPPMIWKYDDEEEDGDEEEVGGSSFRLATEDGVEV